MSRTLHLSLDEGQVAESCRKHAVGISAIEPLVSGGTRLVTMSVDGATKMRTKLKRDIIKEEVERTPLYLRAGAPLAGPIDGGNQRSGVPARVAQGPQEPASRRGGLSHMAFTQLDPPIPLHVADRGTGFAIAVIDYGQEFDLLWVVGMDDGGEVWCVPNPQVRLQANWSMGRKKAAPRPAPKIAAIGA